MRMIPSRTRGTTVVLATTAALAASALTLTTPTSAAPPAPATEQQPVSLAGVSPGPHEITLITGDKVVLGEAGGDRHSVRVEGAARPDGGSLWFRTQSTPDGTYVLPSDAEPAIRAGLVDKELFNVDYLAKNGFTDAATNRIPVLVSYGRAAKSDASALAGKADQLPATSAPVGLRSINGAGVDIDKRATGALWEQLRAPLTGFTARALGAGVAKVWLDRKVKVNLAESVPLVGAPEAWTAGFDGTDVTVAVLDTGIDADHPDVAGKVTGSKSFVSDNAVDGHGHGTHVAATVAGTGAASGGTRKGVAPGAKLVIGKVLSDAGSGSFESIIAGMEWAATEQHADVVSMSLGACCSDGSDPASVAVENLTASTGALFVIAAGNDGPDRETISTPGSADAALTVGGDEQAGRPGRLLQPRAAARQPGPQAGARRTGRRHRRRSRRRHLDGLPGGRRLHQGQRYVDGDAAHRRRGRHPGAEAPGLAGGTAQGGADEHRAGRRRHRLPGGRRPARCRPGDPPAGLRHHRQAGLRHRRDADQRSAGAGRPAGRVHEPVRPAGHPVADQQPA